ncbi:hypothetical protein BDS110ZK25_41670 [Bradyrhizobium diazoefficiens]
MQAIGWFGGISVVTVGAAAFVSKWVADRSIESHKAQLGQETERLKGELAKETESHKFALKKLEIRYNRQIDAALAYSKAYKKLEPRYSHPDKDWDEVLEEVMENFADIAAKLSDYLAEYGVFLSEKNRNDLEKCESIATNHQYTFHGAGPYSRNDSKEQAAAVLKRLKKVKDRFVEEIEA